MCSDINLCQLQPYMQSVNLSVIVIDGGENRATANGSVTTMRVADLTGSINLSFMNPEFTETFKPGDILKIRNGFGSIFQSRLHLGINGRSGECKKDGSFLMVFSETPNFSEKPVAENLKDPREVQKDRERRRDNNQAPRYGSRPPLTATIGRH